MFGNCICFATPHQAVGAQESRTHRAPRLRVCSGCRVCKSICFGTNFLSVVAHWKIRVNHLRQKNSLEMSWNIRIFAVEPSLHKLYNTGASTWTRVWILSSDEWRSIKTLVPCAACHEKKHSSNDENMFKLAVKTIDHVLFKHPFSLRSLCRTILKACLGYPTVIVKLFAANLYLRQFNSRRMVVVPTQSVGSNRNTKAVLDGWR